MRKDRRQRGALTIEASISYSIFLMVIVSILYIMRIVYLYGLMQHAVSQTAKELSSYSYLYQIAGISDLNQQVSGAAASRTSQFNEDVEEVVRFYEEFSSGNLSADYNGTTDVSEILKNLGAAMFGEAGKEVNHQLFVAVAKPLIESYIGADSRGNSADARLKALRVVDGMSGLNLNSSSFFEDGQTIDLIVCYTIDPIMPIDILPELNLANRAWVRGVSGESVFQAGQTSGQSQETQEQEQEKAKSVWDLSPAERGKAIQEQQNIRSLPERFSTFSAYDAATGKATAEQSIDLRDTSYQKIAGIRNVVRQKCEKIRNYKDTTYGGVTIQAEDIKSRELIIYIPSSTESRSIDRSAYDQAIRELQELYPDIQIVTKEID